MTLLAALLTGFAVWAGLGGRRSLLSEKANRRPTGAAPTLVARVAAARRLVGALAGLAVALLVRGWLGVAVGLAVALLSPLVFGRLEPAANRARRAELVRAAPLVADLIGSTMLAGIPVELAIPAVARAVGGDAEVVLGQLSLRLRMGADPGEAWLALGREPGFEILGRAAARSARTGAPLADILLESGVALRAKANAEGLAQVHAAGVRSVVPLGLCLLPAFVLLGIVPIIAGMMPAFG